MKYTNFIVLLAGCLISAGVFTGCTPDYLIYIYDTQTDTIQGVEHHEVNKPGFFLGNIENVSYCNSNDDFFITTQIADRENSGFVIKKRNYQGRVLNTRFVRLGKKANYQTNGSFCVNPEMNKGVVFSYEQDTVSVSNNNKNTITGKYRDVIFYDFVNNTQKIIYQLTAEDGECQLTWLNSDLILMYKGGIIRQVNIIDISNPDNIMIKNIQNTRGYQISSARQTLYFFNLTGILCYEVATEREYKICFKGMRENFGHIYVNDLEYALLLDDCIKVYNSKESGNTPQIYPIPFPWQAFFSYTSKFLLTSNGILLNLQRKKGEDYIRKFFYINKRDVGKPKFAEIKIRKYISKVYVGYDERYIIFQR